MARPATKDLDHQYQGCTFRIGPQPLQWAFNPDEQSGVIGTRVNGDQSRLARAAGHKHGQCRVRGLGQQLRLSLPGQGRLRVSPSGRSMRSASGQLKCPSLLGKPAAVRIVPISEVFFD